MGIHSIATAFSFTLDTTPPVLVFTSESLSGGGNKLTLTGISDPNSVVTIKDDLAIVGTTTAANDGTWSFNASKITDTVHICTAAWLRILLRLILIALLRRLAIHSALKLTS